ncbi:MAG: sulfide/dihydroorotate dehydrogenase-like FAD/NAD-binding protein [Acidimicrobiia bacterium]
MDDRFTIRELSTVAEDVVRCVVDAPRVAQHAHPGQFVIVRVTDDDERIPLTVADRDPEAGTITLVVQLVGAATRHLGVLGVGDHLADVLGPLGRPTDIERFGRCVLVAGGVGAAIVLPVARALAEAGNHTHAIVGARTADALVLVDDFRRICDEATVMTDDGTAGGHGFVTGALAEVLDRDGADFVFTVGPIPMMAAVADLTRPGGIPTVASLNPIMVDGTGMCGGCRVRVGDETKFACVDGPEFDAHLVDFDLLATRNLAYRPFEECRLTELEPEHA